MNEEKLKPVVVLRGWGGRRYQNRFTQNVLLNALSKGVTDVKTLKKLAGIRSATQVYKTLDKMSIRREYHEALFNAGIDMTFIVAGLKRVCEEAKSDAVRLRGYEIFLKSLGVDNYDKNDAGGSAWEDVMIKTIEKNKEEDNLKRLTNAESGLTPSIDTIRKKVAEEREHLFDDYEVKIPTQPKKAKEMRESEQIIGSDLYGTK
jgi:hypothetical protein